MGIEIIGKLTQKNNGDFKLVDLADVDYDGTGKSAKQELEKKIEEAKNSSTPYDDSVIKADIQTLKTNKVNLVEDETSMEGISDSVHDTLTTKDKTIIGGINELNSQYKDIANTGKLTDLDTTAKDNLVNAINEVFQNVSNGKSLVANAITDKGVNTLATDTFQTMAINIGKISGIDGAIVQIKGITYKLSTDDTGKVIATKIAGVEGLIEGRILLWNEDFEGTSVDTNTWTFDNRDKYNARLNNWTGGARTTVQDSILHIQAVKQKYGSYTADWSSDELWTRKKYANSNCRWECKMKFDVMNGCWPAFWLMGDSFTGTGPETGQGGLGWPACGELDIMEFMGGANGNLSSNAHWTDVLTNTENKSKSIGVFTNKITGELTDWHIYGCEITDTQVTFDVDGTTYATWDISEANSDFGNAFKMPMYPLISLQVGQEGGAPDADATEMNVYVDWVRCYAPVGTTISGDIESMQITGVTTEIATGVKQVANIEYTPVASKNKTVAWSSNNPNVVTVKNGLIESIADGNATITATSKNGISASIDITVSTVAKYPVTALEFDRTYKPIVKDCTYTPNLTTTPDYTTDNIVYSSSDVSKFTVNSNTGVITPVAVGTANLIATADSGITATLPIEIISETEDAYINAHYNGNNYVNDTGVGGLTKNNKGFAFSKINARDDDYTFVVQMNNASGPLGLGFALGVTDPSNSYRPLFQIGYNATTNINNIKPSGETIFETIELANISPYSMKLAIVVKNKVMSYYKNGQFVSSQNIKSSYSFVRNGTTNVSIQSCLQSGTGNAIFYRRALTDAEAKAITT